MIKGIISSKVNGREYFIGERVPTYFGELEVKKIYTENIRFTDEGTRKEVFIIEFEGEYTLYAPFDDYEILYTKEVE